MFLRPSVLSNVTLFYRHFPSDMRQEHSITIPRPPQPGLLWRRWRFCRGGRLAVPMLFQASPPWTSAFYDLHRCKPGQYRNLILGEWEVGWGNEAGKPTYGGVHPASSPWLCQVSKSSRVLRSRNICQSGLYRLTSDSLTKRVSSRNPCLYLVCLNSHRGRLGPGNLATDSRSKRTITFRQPCLSANPVFSSSIVEREAEGRTTLSLPSSTSVTSPPQAPCAARYFLASEVLTCTTPLFRSLKG